MRQLRITKECKSTNNTILTNPVSIQISNTTAPIHTDTYNRSTIASQISRSVNETIRRVDVFEYNLIHIIYNIIFIYNI